MMDASRRSILKMFGVTVAAGATGAAAVAAPTVVKERVAMPFLDLPFKPPSGMTYQWKRIFITQDEPDMQNIVAMIKAGWNPVPASRHHILLSVEPHYWIEQGGLVLMEKPTDQLTPPRAHPLPWEEGYDA
jgi:hypothetical protein